MVRLWPDEKYALYSYMSYVFSYKEIDLKDSSDENLWNLNRKVLHKVQKTVFYGNLLYRVLSLSNEP